MKSFGWDSGLVIERSPLDICMGKPIAFIGHKVQCPKCKGVCPIIEGAPTTRFYGKGVTLTGMKTACGPVLIAGQLTDRVALCGGAEEPAKGRILKLGWTLVRMHRSDNEEYSGTEKEFTGRKYFEVDT